jgi:integrase
MRIKLKGINRVTKRLADGRAVTYWYAWKGGPALKGDPGSPEFVASYNEAVKRRAVPPAEKLAAIIDGYQQSDDFRQLAPRTRSDYMKQIKLIEAKFGTFPLSALSDRRTRGIFKGWRDELPVRSRRQADYAWTVLALIIAWAHDRGQVGANPCQRGGRLYRGSRADKIWTLDDEAAMLARCGPQLRLPLLLALWTGQRQGDLLRLPWSAYDGSDIRLRQSKTGIRVVIKVGAPLKAALDAAPRVSTLILTSSEKRPWSPDGFRSSWRKAKAAAGIVGITFNDLRGTAVTRLALAGATEAEIATITGHTLREVRSILDAHYLHRDPALGASAIAKLERTHAGENLPTAHPTDDDVLRGERGKRR